MGTPLVSKDFITQRTTLKLNVVAEFRTYELIEFTDCQTQFVSRQSLEQNRLYQRTTELTSVS